MVEISTLCDTVRAAWGADTSNNWDPARPSQGQCAVTALVLQDYLGGQLLRVENEGVSHYFLGLGDTTIDLTRDQFEVWCPSEAECRTREYVPSFPDTARRYASLKQGVAALLAAPAPADPEEDG